MGANSRRRKASRQRAGAEPSGHRSGGVFGSVAPPPPNDRIGADRAGADRAGADRAEAYQRVQTDVRAAVHRLSRDPRDVGLAVSTAELVLGRVRPISAHVVADVTADVLAATVDPTLAGGWGPVDLVELVRRSGDPSYVPALLTALHDEARHNAARGAAWLAALSVYGEDPRHRLDTPRQLASALAVTALLLIAPLLTAESLLATPDDATTHPKLARVRALLAKAESTTFPEEAEALSAKAQELIARYSLDELVDRARPGGASDMVTRRIWLDPPYVGAKASLVSAVAAANHARSATSTRHGFCIVVGAPHDLDAVELLVTSLLVQADRAMLAHGRRPDRVGTSRTRSFRQSFLLAYAERVGERLQQAAEAVASADARDLLPVLRSHDERVGAAFEAMVPTTPGRARSVSNYEGWVAGVAAADVAQLGVRGQVTDAS